MTDEYNLQRFLDAQDHVCGAVLNELRAGEKSSHWMWFIFPQITGLDHSGAPRPYPSSVADYCGGRAAVVPFVSSAEPAEPTPPK
jgi:uncharacterized protein (DUF1810 family)